MRSLPTILALALTLTGAHAQPFPSRQILLVVPFAAGGSNDIMARVIGERLQKAWGQSVVVENQTGAAGSIGVGRVAKAEADGHTLAVISITFTINAVTQARQAFDPIASFAAVALLGRSPMLLAISPRHGVSTPAEFLALARSASKPLAYGSAGAGSITHIGAELLRQALDLKLDHVPYRGTPLALNDVIGGHVDLVVASLPPLLEQIRAGKVTGIGVMAKERVAALPELATFDATIAPGLELYQWWGILAPAGTPPEVISRLNAGITAAQSSDDFKAIMAREGAEPTPGPPGALAALIRNDIERWHKLVRDGSLQLGEKQ